VHTLELSGLLLAIEAVAEFSGVAAKHMPKFRNQATCEINVGIVSCSGKLVV
jgi:hypothetical protein